MEIRNPSGASVKGFAPSAFGGLTGSVSGAQRIANVAAFASARTAALATGGVVFIDGVYEIAGAPVDFRASPGLSIYCGTNARIIQYTDNIQGLMIGGAKVMLTGLLEVWYANAQGTSGAATLQDGSGGANAVEFWNLKQAVIGGIRTYRGARGFHIPQVDADGLGSNLFFDNAIQSLDVNFASYRPMDFRSFNGGSTTSHIQSVKLRGQGIGTRTNMNIAAVFTSMELAISSFNVEHMSPGGVASADTITSGTVVPAGSQVALQGAIVLSDSQLSIQQTHYEGIEPKVDHLGMVFLQSFSSFTTDQFAMVFSYFLNANGVTFSHLVRMFGTAPSADIRRIYERNNTVTSAVLDLAYSAAALTRADVKFGPSTYRTSLSLTGNVVATNDQKVIKEVEGRAVRPYVTGRYYSSDDANGAAVVVTKRLYAHRIEVFAPIKVDLLAAYVNTAQASSEALYALYNHDGTTQPGSLVAQVNAKVSTATTTTQSGTVTGSPLIAPGVYWGSFIGYSTIAGTMPTIVTVAQAVANDQNTNLGGADGAFVNASGSANSGVFADITIADNAAWTAFTMPTTFPAATISNAAPTPRVLFRTAAVV